MAIAEQSRVVGDVNLIIEAVRDAEESALEAVRKFVDTVNGILPDVRDDGPRRKIIDSAVRMTEAMVGLSADVAEKIVIVASDPWTRTERGGEPLK